MVIDRQKESERERETERDRELSNVGKACSCFSSLLISQIQKLENVTEEFK